MDITKLIMAVITLLLAIITTFVIPWVKANKTQTQLATWNMWVKIAVTAAEQIFTSDQWAEKKQYVLNYLNSKGIKYDSATVNNMIESAVLELHAALAKEKVPNEKNLQYTEEPPQTEEAEQT